MRDRCRLVGTKTLYIEPGSPWENPVHGELHRPGRDELLNGENFATGGLASGQELAPGLLGKRLDGS